MAGMMDVDNPPSGTPGAGDGDEVVGWKKGEFQLLFIYMGRGDCCVVTCPNGKHIVIDCGSNQSDHDVGELSVVEFIRSNDVLNLNDSTKEEVEALILTHPDEDHISQVGKVLAMVHYDEDDEGDEPAPKKQKLEKDKKIAHNPIKVKKVYFSDTQTALNIGEPYTFPLYSYQEQKNGNCAHTIKTKLKPDELYRVRLNKEESKYDKWTHPYNHPKNHEEKDIEGDEFPVLKAEDNTWSVSIIAGNVLKDPKEKRDKSDSTNSNAGSLVVLIKIGNEKALICGDATISTENYLLAKYKDKNDIRNLDLIQVPHHGSELTSSSKEFLEMTRPKRAIVSVKKIETGNRHPSKTVISRYKLYAIDGDQHPIHYWELNKSQYSKEKRAWTEGDKDGNYTFVDAGTTWVKKYKKDGKVEDVDETYNGYVALFAAGNTDGYKKGMLLYQEATKKEIYETGVNKDYWIYLKGK